jgi:DNA-binding transcriptional ArsR family regulator
VLRIHFAYEDLAKVALDDRVPPICETVLSLQILTGTDQHLRYGPWRASLEGRASGAVRRLRDLVPAQGWIPDFLTPVVRGDARDAAALDAIRHTSLRQIRTELTRLGSTSRLPGWVRSLADGDADAMASVTDALAAWKRLAITPHEKRVQTVLDAEVARKATVLTYHGVDALLRGLHPAVTWQPPVLTVPSSIEADIELAGRGLRLVPTLFCSPLPRLWLGEDTDRAAVLAYQLPFDPVAANPFSVTRRDQETQGTPALGRLLGSTRSNVLSTIAAVPGLSTADLAHRVDIALATASEHATVLREAGLISTHRDGNRVRHYATATAAALLERDA